MRLSKAFWRSLRQPPSDAVVASQGRLVQAGFIRQLGAGIFTLLPFGRRVSDRIEDIMRDEMCAIGGQELSMPVVNPAEIWKESGRWFQIGDEMGRFTDRVGRDMVLAMTHEEVVGQLTRDLIRSYRQLPQLIFHIQTKWRDDPRPRAGLIRVREFVMKDSYSLDPDEAGLSRQYEAHYQAYFNIFRRCGIPVVSVLADVGMMGGSASHEFMYLTPAGEDSLLMCSSCGHRANRQIATFTKPTVQPEEPRDRVTVDTPGITTIEELAGFLDVERSATAKAVFQVALVTTEEADGRRHDVEHLVFAVVRGDMELSETKLRNAVGAKELRAATDAEIRAVGAVPGYASPIALESRPDLIVVADDLVAASPNLVSGANEEGKHFLNVNHGRDWTAAIVTDIVAAREGDACPECGGVLDLRRGVEVGNIFKLGTRYSESMDCTYLAADGTERLIWMGSYGIGSGRLLACIAEEHSDERGLAWPITVAPYPVHLVELTGAADEADSLHADLVHAGIDVLHDDRDESAGVKFNDADLLGMPIRVTIGSRSLQAGGVEVRLRTGEETTLVPTADAVTHIQGIIRALNDDITQRLTPELI